MRFLTRTIIVSAILIPATANLAPAQFSDSPIAFTICGNTGIGGVVMKGLPNDLVTDGRGYYSVEVPYGWSGKVTPMKEGYTFEPVLREYSKITSNQDNDNYQASVIKFTISGNAGVYGVTMRGLPNIPVTDGTGHYAVKVDYGWNGRVEPTKEGYDFDPPGLIYEKVVRDLINQNYTPLQHGQVAHPTSEGYPKSHAAWEYMDGKWLPMQARTSRRSAGYQPTIRSGGRRVLVIPAGEVKAKELAETIEDMHVMSHILDEQFKEKRPVQGLFTDFGAFFGRDNRKTEATYLQDFGVLFLMEVNFAFSPLPKQQAQEPNEPAEAVDSTWQRAREEVFSPGASRGMDEENSARDYDNQMVKELKKELVKALRHATNIRNIDPTEWVVLTVIGGQRQYGMSFGGGMSGFGGSGGSSGGGGSFSGAGFVMGGYGGVGGTVGAGGGGGMYSGMGTYGGTTVSTSTVLTIRAKKSDVDDFAKGRTDLGQFQERVQIFMY